jgi:tRNA A37 threonylcarbamoyladenosine synthetase subunit TsaC/SUA5/YrdC
MKKFIFNYSHPDTKVISTVTQLLMTDHVGIIPTDTVYGLAAVCII